MQGVMWCVMQCGMWCNITIESCAICAAVMWREVVHDVECDAMNKMRSDAQNVFLWYGMVRCGMCYNVTAPCFATSHHHMVLWYGMVHDVVWWMRYGMCYNAIAPSQQHNSTSNCTTFHISSCNSTHHALPHGTTTYCTPCEMWCAVMFCDMECGVVRCGMLPHISHIAPYCRSCDVMRCGVMWYGMVHEMECGMRCYKLHMLCHIIPPHIAHHSCTIIWHSHITCGIICNMWWCDVVRWCMVWTVM